MKKIKLVDLPEITDNLRISGSVLDRITVINLLKYNMDDVVIDRYESDGYLLKIPYEGITIGILIKDGDDDLRIKAYETTYPDYICMVKNYAIYKFINTAYDNSDVVFIPDFTFTDDRYMVISYDDAVPTSRLKGYDINNKLCIDDYTIDTSNVKIFNTHINESVLITDEFKVAKFVGVSEDSFNCMDPIDGLIYQSYTIVTKSPWEGLIKK